MTPTMTQPVLVYTRIGQNRRKTWLLVAFAIASIIPFVLAMSYGISAIIVAEVGGRQHRSRVEQIKFHKAMADATVNLEGSLGFADEMRMRELELRREDERESRVDAQILNQSMVAISLGLLAVLGILFWGISSSPTAKVLALSGARPADAPEAECKRLLENLSIGAGLPTPRLYVIESSSPNAFAAGTDPKHSVVVVTRGLLQLMDQRELEGVLAHELSHIANRDTRLNTIVASIALFLRLPYLLRKRQRLNSAGSGEYNPFYRRFQMYRLALSPLYLYIFFIAPVMASVIRAAISRSREFLADADAALLTRYPEGLMRALAKIRGAGSSLRGANPVVSHFYFGDPAPAGFSIGMLAGNLLATHPPIDQRIVRLMEFNGGVTATTIEAALKAGQQFTKAHPAIADNDFAPVAGGDELSVLTVGNAMGRVCRVTGLSAPAPIYDRPDPRSPAIGRVKDGDLLVVFDDPGKYRQIITPNQTFGYISYSVKLIKTDMFPNEVFNMKASADPAVATQSTPAADLPSPAPADEAPEIKIAGLTLGQLTVAGMLFLGVFVAMILVLTHFGGK